MASWWNADEVLDDLVVVSDDPTPGDPETLDSVETTGTIRDDSMVFELG